MNELTFDQGVYILGTLSILLAMAIVAFVRFSDGEDTRSKKNKK